jgi:hypothetical protein
MSSNEKSARNRELISSLHSTHENLVLQGIADIRRDGNPEVLGHLVDLIFRTSNPQIEVAAVNLINDLKDQSAVAVIVDKLHEHRGENKLDKIVSACWQNGLDYSSDIDLFIDIAIEEDYLCCIEAFTVIEGNINNLSPKDRESKASNAEKRIAGITDNKKVLLKEMISVLRTVSGPFSVDRDTI